MKKVGVFGSVQTMAGPWRALALRSKWSKFKVKLLFIVCIGSMASSRSRGKVLQRLLTGAVPVGLVG